MLINLYTNAGTIQVDSLRYTSIKKLIDICIITTEGYKLNKNRKYIDFYFEFANAADYCETDILLFRSKEHLESFSKAHLYNVGQEILKDGKIIYVN